MGRIAALAAAVLVLAGCGSSSTDDAADIANGKFIGDVEAQGVSTGQLDGTAGAKLAHAVCDDIKGGSAAANVAISVSDNPNFTLPQAEIITYYAITDICPDQIGQRQDHWRDGT